MSTDLEQLQARVDQLERVLATQSAKSKAPRKRHRVFVAMAVVLFAAVVPLWASTAWAATCAQTLPAPMVTFCPNNPAVAADVNANFQQLATWVEAKTGTISNTNITAQSITSVGAVRAAMVDSASGLNLTWNKSAGTGESDFQNFPGLGPGGFAFYNNNTKIASLDSAGNLAINGSITLAANGTIAGSGGTARRPSFMASANCTAVTCSISCAPGVVKWAVGFHGANYNSKVDLSAWQCGNGMTWLGNCIGSASCSVTTNCNPSSVFAECW